MAIIKFDFDGTENFRRHEFACKGSAKTDNFCCGLTAAVSLELIKDCQRLRNRVSDILGRKTPMVPTSAFRCKPYNRSQWVASNDRSQHVRGLAVDFAIPDGMTLDEFYEAALTVPRFRRGGKGKYDTFLHLDIREVDVMWDCRKKNLEEIAEMAKRGEFL